MEKKQLTVGDGFRLGIGLVLAQLFLVLCVAAALFTLGFVGVFLAALGLE